MFERTDNETEWPTLGYVEEAEVVEEPGNPNNHMEVRGDFIFISSWKRNKVYRYQQSTKQVRYCKKNFQLIFFYSPRI